MLIDLAITRSSENFIGCSPLPEEASSGQDRKYMYYIMCRKYIYMTLCIENMIYLFFSILFLCMWMTFVSWLTTRVISCVKTFGNVWISKKNACVLLKYIRCFKICTLMRILSKVRRFHWTILENNRYAIFSEKSIYVYI